MKSYLSTIVAGFLGISMFLACGEQKKPDMSEVEAALDSAEQTMPEISSENIEAILSSIPSPLELSSHIQEAGIHYDKSLLNDPDNYSRYTSSFQKALNLGIYGTDLGYTNLYEQTQDGLNYLAVIQKLSDDLNIGQFFDFESLKRLTDNKSNLDSLLMITNQNFNRINNHFIEQNNASLSALLLTGGWLEALHLANQVTLSRMQNQDLRERLGEQKIVLDNILILLEVYGKNDKQIAGLLDDFRRLEVAFRPVTISYHYEESTSRVVDGVLEIESTSTSEVSITDEDIRKIAEITEEIRNKVIS
ncbi:MAG TPA: hypothetical protein ENJ39_05875 [Flammeovirgaceae bacterium]|nr:hypothetical protein [Flammeovirgaceae bacterium]